ncbi:MAG TPA: acylphosphatase [Dokdonella sp.]|uniref:acylphosphatase n=1 Tax=Dokdonella sp. TaxID=2291710 RepID=UPI002D12F7A4|nr:acylphosphatase [Dokdonella sp.]HUD43055.1 acylphosphatase [Dokdonella sp.]
MPLRRYRVTGRVQSVSFRASTRDRALALGIAGHARNLADGSVEVLASGSSEALAALEVWLRRGPPAARVDALHAEDIDADAAAPTPAGFGVR